MRTLCSNGARRSVRRSYRGSTELTLVFDVSAAESRPETIHDNRLREVDSTFSAPCCLCLRLPRARYVPPTHTVYVASNPSNKQHRNPHHVMRPAVQTDRNPRTPPSGPPSASPTKPSTPTTSPPPKPIPTGATPPSPPPTAPPPAPSSPSSSSTRTSKSTAMPTSATSARRGSARRASTRRTRP